MTEFLDLRSIECIGYILQTFYKFTAQLVNLMYVSSLKRYVLFIYNKYLCQCRTSRPVGRIKQINILQTLFNGIKIYIRNLNQREAQLMFYWIKVLKNDILGILVMFIIFHISIIIPF